MSGTKAGAQRMRETLIEKHGSEEAMREWFRSIAAVGGRNSNTGGFYRDYDRARESGAKGGRRGRKGHIFLYERDGYLHYTLRKTGEPVKYKAA